MCKSADKSRAWSRGQAHDVFQPEVAQPCDSPFWILDFGFRIFRILIVRIARHAKSIQNPKSKTQNSFHCCCRCGPIFNYVTSYGGSGHSVRRCQIHLTRPAATWEVSILRADYNLLFGGADTRAGVDARATTGLDDIRADFLQHVHIAAFFTILTHLNRAELNEALHVVMNPLATR